VYRGAFTLFVSLLTNHSAIRKFAAVRTVFSKYYWLVEWLNYHHLLYFWTVARQGSLTRAGAELRLAPSTISGQISALEHALGEQLFTRSGRRLVLTEIGRMTFRYADEIFALGRELQGALHERPLGRPLRLVVGIADVVPKLVARRLIEPALQLAEPVHIVCREDRPDRLLAELSLHEIDVVISDVPVSPSVRPRSFSHLLGECGITFFGSPARARGLRRGFPRSLDGTPMLLPTENTATRRALDHWFNAHEIHPQVVAEFEDNALLEVFGQTGMGVFPAASVIAKDLQRRYGVRLIGHLDEVQERYYAISVERRLKHPAVVAIAEAARATLFEE
jgi:LysR family transcriptional regulator, transcriptional activator of nhaA